MCQDLSIEVKVSLLKRAALAPAAPERPDNSRLGAGGEGRLVGSAAPVTLTTFFRTFDTLITFESLGTLDTVTLKCFLKH